MIDHHDALLSKLIDDAFYGRPLIAVTGVEGAGKTTLARRFAQQFANEAECIALKASDFKNRDDFIQRLVSKLSPDSVEYAADTLLILLSTMQARLPIKSACSFSLLMMQSH